MVKEYFKDNIKGVCVKVSPHDVAYVLATRYVSLVKERIYSTNLHHNPDGSPSYSFGLTLTLIGLELEKIDRLV